MRSNGKVKQGRGKVMIDDDKDTKNSFIHADGTAFKGVNQE